MSMEERYLIKEYNSIKQFSEVLETHLARWLKDHEDMERRASSESEFVTGESISLAGGSCIATPDFSYWMAEAITLLKAPAPDYRNVMFCARKATESATSDFERAQGRNITGIALFHLGKPDEAIATFSAIAETFAVDADRDDG
jgi:hypothetical protein